MHKINRFVSCAAKYIRFRQKGSTTLHNIVENVNLEGKKGLVLGVYTSEEKPNKLTEIAAGFDASNNNVLCEFLESLASPLALGQSTTFTNIDPDFFNICLVGLGRDTAAYNSIEDLDECKENSRIAAGVGVRKLRETGISCILIDQMSDIAAAAEGANLAVWRYQDYRADENQIAIANLDVYGEGDREEWERGIIKSAAQNLARKLSDAPANCMTPSIFCQTAGDILCPCGVQIEVRNQDWLEAKKMHSFLSVSRGSCEQPALLEIGYCGGPVDDKPILLIGKGTTFNSGGLSLYESRNMDEMRADMSGAAVVVAIIKAAASLSLPINIRGVIPLCENVPSGMAVKPGDIIYSMAGKAIMVQDTGREGTLMLADALTYGQAEYKPKLVIDIATLTHGARDCLGAGATAVTTNDEEVWSQVRKAGSITGDRMWRLPLWEYYTDKVTSFPESDLHNVGLGVGGSPCLAAAFLQEFVVCNDWLHMDTTGTGMISHGDEIPYLPKGRMTGRPTRAILQFLYQLACGAEIESE